MPQGSVLGPLLFSLFVSPVTDIVLSYGLQCHTYADDVAIYFSCYPRDICSFLDTLRSCLNHVYDWFSSNRLKVNPDKTGVFMCGSKHSLSLIDFSHVDILGHTLPILTSVKFLGVTFDSNLTFDVHISNIRRKCFLQVRNLYRVRKYVNAHCLF